MADIHHILKEYWGYDSFRPLQETIIRSVLEQKDTLALLPTGGGKSLCFQVPALVQKGICLVVSPLIALMKDQVENLKKKGILAAAIYSGMSRKQIEQTLKNVSYGPYKFLYVSPERLETALFREYLPAMNVNLIVIDEAHCISQWGYDFRPSYLRIAELRDELPQTPMLALTASATEEVQKDICEKLQFRNEHILRQSFERKNLSYSVFCMDAKMTKLLEILTKVPGCSIVYCKSRKRTVEIGSLLQMHGLSAAAYHAGLPQQERAQRQQDWIDNKMRVMVCTNAFGMGIDKPDVRAVVHMDIPDCLENYYQEAGRAGRDGNKSYAVLLFDERDLEELASLHEKRFPAFTKIKEVYGAVANYLQIPVHSGEDSSYTFRFEDFIQKFKMEAQAALYSLKALEGDGWLLFHEKSFIPSTVVFTTSKELLYQFYEAHPELEALLTALLRTYEGIFDYPSFISENLLARVLRKEEKEINDALKKAAAFHILQYTPQNDEPQLIFKKNRVATEHLSFNLKLYEKRKTLFIQRAQKMRDYVNITACRSQFINLYFGDRESMPCGICDQCLRAKTRHLSSAEFDTIKNNVLKHLTNASMSLPDLLAKLNGIPKEKARSVINFLQAEQKITTDQKGRLSRR